jgi:myo-inositol-1(or 4)-monophosphatase
MPVDIKRHQPRQEPKATISERTPLTPSLTQGGNNVDVRDHETNAMMQFSLDVIQRAGNEAMTYYGKGSRGMKFDQELATSAELQLRRFFEREIRDNYPEHRVFDNNLRASGYTHDEKRYLWVFDPIDGIANFLAGIPIWGVSLALLDNFWPITGVFHMPATGDLFHAQAGKYAFRGEQKIVASTKKSINNESLMMIYSRFHRNYHSNFPGKIANMGCTGAHICYVAMGRADAAFVANESYQDLSAAQIIIQAAGGKIFKMDGRELTFNEYIDGKRRREHLLATTADLCSPVLACLQPSSA